MFGSFDASAFKVHLKTAIARMQLQRNKKSNLVKLQKREIAGLLEKGKDESARIKVEHVIREDFTTEALEILELFCDLLLARLPIIKEQKTLPGELAEAVHTLIYASYRVEVTELQQVREDLVKKYGKLLAKSALENSDGSVNPRVINKLATAAPEQFLVLQYLKEIAKAHNIEWEAGDWQQDLSMHLPMPMPGTGPAGGGGGMGDPRLLMLAPYPQGPPMTQPYSGAMLPDPPSGIPRMPEYSGVQARSSPPPPAPYDSRSPYSSAGPTGPAQPPPFMMGAPPPFPMDGMPPMPMPPPPASSQPQMPTMPAPHHNDGGDLPDFDELTRRFEALKRRD